MNEHTKTITADQRDLLVSRIVDGRASGDDWRVFKELASIDHAIWAELSATQQVQSVLGGAVEHEIAPAERVELPFIEIETHRFQHRLDGVAKWGGWVAAAAIVLAWFGGRGMVSSRPAGPDGQVAGISAGLLTPDAALDQYIESGQQAGRVIGQVPERLVLETTPTTDGRMEVVYLRQIIERRFVDEVYTTTRDEMGNPIEVPAVIVRTRSGSF